MPKLILISIYLILFPFLLATMNKQHENLKIKDLLKDEKTWKKCEKFQAITKLTKKKLIKKKSLFENDPYQDQSLERKKELAKYLNNSESVCALKYIDSARINYHLKTFENKEEAEKNDYYVTHQGRCGVCSSLRDLILYLRLDMTKLVSDCAVKSLVSKKRAMNCLKKLGFSDACAEIWYYNSLHTVKNCLWSCLYYKIFKTPKIDKQGNLNKCLACDENNSGPVFKYEAGRTRRNSGIKSEIPRDPREVYQLEHYYH